MSQHYKPYDGVFITLEGGDGSGKSTLSDKLATHFQNNGYSVLRTREPGGTPLSEHIRALLLDKKSKLPLSDSAELFLFLAARLQHIEDVICPALRDGKIVFCDRFNDSTIAYQGCARTLGCEYVEHICKLATRDLEPDCTLLLDIDPEIALKRVLGEKDRLESELLQFHREVRSGYLHLADKYPNRISILDAALPQDALFEAALKELEAHLKMKKPIKR